MACENPEEKDQTLKLVSIANQMMPSSLWIILREKENDTN